MGQMSGAELVHEVNRRLAIVGWVAGAAGSAVVFLSIGFLIPIFLDPDDRLRLGLINAPLILVYLFAIGFVIRRLTRRHLLRTTEWLVEDREPDEREHRRTLALALYGVKYALAGWIGAVVVFAIETVLVE